MFVNADAADLKLVASYIDRLVLSLDRMSESLEMMETEIETLSESDAPKGTAATKRPQTKKSAKKAVKKARSAKKKKR
jgi:hypothetical protein